MTTQETIIAVEQLRDVAALEAAAHSPAAWQYCDDADSVAEAAARTLGKLRGAAVTAALVRLSAADIPSRGMAIVALELGYRAPELGVARALERLSAHRNAAVRESVCWGLAKLPSLRATLDRLGRDENYYVRVAAHGATRRLR